MLGRGTGKIKGGQPDPLVDGKAGVTRGGRPGTLVGGGAHVSPMVGGGVRVPTK